MNISVGALERQVWVESCPSGYRANRDRSRRGTSPACPCRLLLHRRYAWPQPLIPLPSLQGLPVGRLVASTFGHIEAILGAVTEPLRNVRHHEQAADRHLRFQTLICPRFGIKAAPGGKRIIVAPQTMQLVHSGYREGIEEWDQGFGRL